MSETAITLEKLRDEAYVKELVGGMGGPEAIIAGLREYGLIVERMWAERAALTEAHPNRWVAMGKDGILAIGRPPSMKYSKRRRARALAAETP